MAKNSYPEELLAFLQECLTDGVITAKEREVLLKKAEKLGVDRDEFDLYIDAQEQKIDQTSQVASNRLRGIACPYCGGSVQQMADKCPHCGEAITIEASNELKEIIETLESSLVDLKINVTNATIANVKRYVRKAELYYSNNPKVKKLVAEVNIEMEAAKDKAKQEAVVKGSISLIKKILTSKLLWFVGLEFIIGKWCYSATDHDMGAVVMALFYGGFVIGMAIFLIKQINDDD